jgi:hypothetical protein
LPRALVAVIFRLIAEIWFGKPNLSPMWASCPEFPVGRSDMAREKVRGLPNHAGLGAVMYCNKQAEELPASVILVIAIK